MVFNRSSRFPDVSPIKSVCQVMRIPRLSDFTHNRQSASKRRAAGETCLRSEPFFDAQELIELRNTFPTP